MKEFWKFAHEHPEHVCVLAVFILIGGVFTICEIASMIIARHP